MMTAEIELHKFPPNGLTKTRGQPLASVRWTARFACLRDIWQRCAGPPVCPPATEFPRACCRSTDFPGSPAKSIFDLGAYGGGRHFRAVGGLDMTGKEIPELEHATRSVHVFGGGDA